MAARKPARRRFGMKAFSGGCVVDVATVDQELAEDETTLVINDWRFVGTGRFTVGDAVLVADASAIAREYANARTSEKGPSGTVRHDGFEEE